MYCLVLFHNVIFIGFIILGLRYLCSVSDIDCCNSEERIPGKF